MYVHNRVNENQIKFSRSELERLFIRFKYKVRILSKGYWNTKRFDWLNCDFVFSFFLLFTSVLASSSADPCQLLGWRFLSGIFNLLGSASLSDTTFGFAPDTLRNAGGRAFVALPTRPFGLATRAGFGTLLFTRPFLAARSSTSWGVSMGFYTEGKCRISHLIRLHARNNFDF